MFKSLKIQITVDLIAPYGYELTGEFRVPKDREMYLSAESNYKYIGDLKTNKKQYIVRESISFYENRVTNSKLAVERNKDNVLHEIDNLILNKEYLKKAELDLKKEIARRKKATK